MLTQVGLGEAAVEEATIERSLTMSGIHSPLDDPQTYALDRSGMFERLSRTGGRLVTEWRRGGAQLHVNGAGPISSLVIAGMGGSAVAGDYLAALARQSSPVPVEIVRDFHMPAWVGPSTLVIACSHSGNTPETLNAYREARARGARLGVVTSGGTLRQLAERDRTPCWAIDPEGPPRVASASILGALLSAGCEVDVVCAEDLEVEAAAAEYARLAGRFSPSMHGPANEAKELALSLAGRIPFVIGAGHLIPAATRFKNQLAENGKVLAAVDSLPEAGHNLVVGLSTAELHHEHIALVLLEGAASHHFHVSQRFDLLAEHFGAAGVPVHRVPIAADSPLAEQMGASAWADYSSAYVALLHGEDPTPVPQIDAMKESLAAGPDPTEPAAS